MLRVPIERLSEGERDLDESTTRYVTRVHRLERGDRFLGFDPDAAVEATVAIVALGPRARVHIDEPQPSRNVPTRRVTVIQAASKGTKIEDVLRDATELGVTRFVVAIGERSIKRPEANQLGRWRRVAIEASRQCGRGDVPEIAGPMPLSEALEEPGQLRLFLDPRGRPMMDVREFPATSVVLAIGPEGGFSPDELALAAQNRFDCVRLGRFVLRTETACAATLGALSALLDDTANFPSTA
jgi:16S rRNA (uracil1498-N3)-methyltransferase